MPPLILFAQLASPDAVVAATATPAAGPSVATAPNRGTAQPLQPAASAAAANAGAASNSVGSETPPDHVTQQGPDGTGNCRTAAEKMAHGEQNTTTRGTSAVDTLDQNDTPTASQVTSDRALSDLESQIQQHDRAVIGVNRAGDPDTPNAEFGDRATNHFVTAYRVERHADGGVTIHYRDPGTSRADRSLGTLYRPPGGTVFQGRRPYVGTGGTQPDYQMTTVRRRKPL